MTNGTVSTNSILSYREAATLFWIQSLGELSYKDWGKRSWIPLLLLIHEAKEIPKSKPLYILNTSHFKYHIRALPFSEADPISMALIQTEQLWFTHSWNTLGRF